MLRLHGFPSSNYYQVVKLALSAKRLPFEEVLAFPPADAEYLARNPTGKFPCLETEDGHFLGETKVILNFLEDAYPETPLLPADPVARARIRELMEIVDLHLELPARRLYDQALFDRPASEEVKSTVRALLQRGLAGLRARAGFAPFLAGPDLTLADFCAVIHLPVVRTATRRVYGEDPLADVPGLVDYLRRMRQREDVTRAREEQREHHPEFMKRQEGHESPPA